MALARALAIEPRVLLLDEPFGALDAKVRKDLRRWLRDLHQRLGLTSIFVTHDQEEALELADQVVVMRQSRIEQIGSPRQIYDRPATPFVYEFLGSANRLPCHVRAGRIDVAGGRLEAPFGNGIADGPAWLFVRPHDLAVEPAGRATRDGGNLDLGDDHRPDLSAAAQARADRGRGRGRDGEEPLRCARRSPPAPRSRCGPGISGCSRLLEPILQARPRIPQVSGSPREVAAA